MPAPIKLFICACEDIRFPEAEVYAASKFQAKKLYRRELKIPPGLVINVKETVEIAKPKVEARGSEVNVIVTKANQME